MDYEKIIKHLESLSVMPKVMPGLEKMKRAVTQTEWFKRIDEGKVILVAGTNGKGTTAAALEALLIAAGKSVGLYTSPHLVDTTERLRLNGVDVSRGQFAALFGSNQNLIEACALTHFESLTLLAGDFFFNRRTPLDFVIFEVGLGGLFDATNVFPHRFAIITKLGLDHQNILGSTLPEIAVNKFGIVSKGGIVIHHELPAELGELPRMTAIQTGSEWHPGFPYRSFFDERRQAWGGYFAENENPIYTNMAGERAIENIATALKAFKLLGFDYVNYPDALTKVRWPGRMQKVAWPSTKAPVFLSGDHNPQGMRSLIEILKMLRWKTLHVIVGIGLDKDADPMIEMLDQLDRLHFYFTETPFKGRALDDYEKPKKNRIVGSDVNPIRLLDQLATNEGDLVLVTGSLYLVGLVLGEINNRAEHPPLT